MKNGRTLTELAAEILRQSELRKDYVADTRALAAVVTDAEEPEVRLQVAATGDNAGLDLGINPLAHEQLAGALEIPRTYYRRMQAEDPHLLATNVNTWLARDPKRRMLRTLDGNLRAYLSDRYRPLDNLELAEAVLPVLQDMNLDVLSCEVTERRLYLKFVDKRIAMDIPTGRRMGDGSHVFFDTVSPAGILSNSEVGCGALSLEVGIWTKVCTNLAIASQRSLRKYHVGGRAELGEEVFAMLSDDTRKKTDAATWGQVRDVLVAAFDKARFEALANDVAQTAQDKIEGDPIKVVEVVSKQLGITEGERPSILRHLVAGGDLTRYGLHAAITRSAEDVPDYDRATELERAGGLLVELPRNAWNVLANAA